MAISNTSILIKRSSANNTPGILQSGELGYSYKSNTLFFGTAGGNGVVNVGGQFYTSTLDAATSANVAGTLVRRDQTGSFNGNFLGNANSATYLQTAQNFSISGGDITAPTVTFYGNNAVVLDAALNAVPGLSAGYYGGSTQSSSTIPIIQVAANGRIMSIANTQVSSAIGISDGTNSNTIYTGATISFLATKGITTLVTPNTVTFGTDTTIVRSNTTSVGPQTIQTPLSLSSDLTVSGNLTVLGTTVSINTSAIESNSGIFYLSDGQYSSDVLDIGFIGHYSTNGLSSGNTHTGLFRYPGGSSATGINPAGGDYIFMKTYGGGNTGIDITSNVQINIAEASFAYANSVANWFKGNLVAINTVTTTANVSGDEGIGGNSYIGGNLSVGGTAKITGQANTTNDLGVGGNLYTTGNFKVGGNVTLSNQLTVPNGGTGVTSFNSGQVVIGNGTGALQQLANVSSINTTLNTNYTVNNLTTDVYGRVTNFTTQSISGLTVSQGGSGVSSFTLNGIIYGNGTNPMQVTAGPGTADQTWSNQFLSVTSAGVPVWSSAMDGGQF